MKKIILVLCWLQLVFSDKVVSQTMTADGHQSILICNDGSIIGTGANGQGQLGSTTYIPNGGIQILLQNDWEKVATGTNHTLFLKNDGTLWVSGDNSSGQLGLNDYVSRDTPEQVGTDTDWVYIDAGYYTSFGIKANGTLWSWGFSSEGALGLGGIGFSIVPMQVGVLDDWVQVSSLRNHTVGLRGDGSLWAWGQNTYGQLGDGTSIPKFEPTNVASSDNWAIVSAGVDHSLAITTSGFLWGVGNNIQGQLGLGDSINFLVDWTVIDDSVSYDKIGAGQQYSIALRSNGTLWSFGYNTLGQLGLGNTTTVTIPTLINTDTNWSDVSVGHTHVIAKKSNGELYSWGDNNSAALGVASCVPTYCSLPQLVPLACSILSVEDLENNDIVKIYPNPANNGFYLDSKQGLQINSIKIFDVRGSQLLSIVKPNEYISTKNIEAGLYNLIIETSKGKAIKKLIIK